MSRCRLNALFGRNGENGHGHDRNNLLHKIIIIIISVTTSSPKTETSDGWLGGVVRGECKIGEQRALEKK